MNHNIKYSFKVIFMTEKFKQRELSVFNIILCYKGE